MSGQEWRPQWPCQANPDRWFSQDRKELGRAVHECLSHCTRLAECEATEAWPAGGVLAGVMYVVPAPASPPQPERRKLREVPCDGCVFADAPRRAPGEPSDTGACGEPRGYHRHIKRHEQPCKRCSAAKNEYARGQYRARGAA